MPFCTSFVSAERIHHALTDIVKPFGELGREVHVHAEHVLIDQHLSVTACTRADADGRDGQLFRMSAASLGGTHSSTTENAPASLYGEGILEQPLCRILALALYFKAAEHVDALRRHADMCLHRNARIRNGANLLGNGCACPPA